MSGLLKLIGPNGEQGMSYSMSLDCFIKYLEVLRQKIALSVLSKIIHLETTKIQQGIVQYFLPLPNKE